MKRILRYPAVNAICISLFSIFYAVVFFVTAGSEKFKSSLYYWQTEGGADPFWTGWSNFLASGFHAYIAGALLAVTALTVVLLLMQRRPYDEYHTSILTHCFVAAIVLTLIAIAVFYLIILLDPNGIIEKFTLFIIVHWVSVVFCDLAFVLLCKRK